MSKLAHGRYGDKLVHTGDPDTPIQVLHKTVQLASLTAAELEALDRLTDVRLKLLDAGRESNSALTWRMPGVEPIRITRH